MIDGPYGGLQQHRVIHGLFDHVVLIAGGGEIAAVLPWMLSLTGVMADTERPCRLQRLNLVWCVKHVSAAAWIEDASKRCLEKSQGKLEIDIHVTSEGEKDSVSAMRRPATASPGREKTNLTHTESIRADEKPSVQPQWMRFHGGRPSLHEFLSVLIADGRTIVIGCGPEGMRIDLSNACARLQGRVLRGKAVEVALHCEAFGW